MEPIIRAKALRRNQQLLMKGVTAFGIKYQIEIRS